MSYEQWPYLGVLAVLIAASLGLPLPEDIPLLTGGYLCHKGQAALPAMIAVGLLGVLSGDIMLFNVGRRLGHRVVRHRFLRRLVNPRQLLMAEELFARHGVKIIFAGRFLPGLRPMIFMAAGVLRVRPAVFVLVNGTAACISVPSLVILGYVFGGSLDQIKRDVRLASHAIGIALIVVALVGAGIWLHRRQRKLMETAHIPDSIDPEKLIETPPPGTTAPDRRDDAGEGI
jgi:membrane protein DedA with SNARE-associated domain